MEPASNGQSWRDTDDARPLRYPCRWDSNKISWTVGGCSGRSKVALTQDREMTHLTRKERDDLEIVRRSAQSVLDLLNRVLGFSRDGTERIEGETNHSIFRIKQKDPILLVAGDMHNRKIMMEILKGRGFSVAEAEDGKRALSMMYTACASARPFRLLLVDTEAMGGDTAEFVRTVKLSPSLASSDIIVMISSKEEDGTALKNMGESCWYMRKPIGESHLLRLIMRVLGRDPGRPKRMGS